MKTQQCCVLSSSIGTILTGLALVSVSRLLLDTDVVLRNLEPSFSPGVFNLGVFVCLTGLCGVVGSCVSSRLALSIYGFGDLISATMGLVLGGVLMFSANMHGVDLQQSCTLFQQAGQSSSDLGKQYQASYDSMKQALQNCRRNGRPSALGLQDCGQLGRDNSGKWFKDDSRQELLSWSEKLSGCGGFCGGDLPLFGFPTGGQATDQSTKTQVRDPCYKTMVAQLQVRGSAKGVILCSLSLPLFAAVCGASWILCYPPPRSRKDYVHPSDGDNVESDRLIPHSRQLSAEGFTTDNSGSEEDD